MPTFVVENYQPWNHVDKFHFRISLEDLSEKEFYFLGVYGAWTGESTLHLIDFVKDRGAKGAIYAVDSFKGESGTETAHIAKRNDIKDILVTNLKERDVENDPDLEVYLIEMETNTASTILPPQTFDLFLIDFESSYKDALNGLANFWHLIAPGGYLMIHLPHQGPEAVTRAVEQYFGEPNLLIRRINNSFWMIGRPDDKS